MDTRPRPSLLAKRDENKEAQLLDNPQKLDFKGWDGPVLHWGEMHFFSKNGIGYVLLVLGPGEPDDDGKKAADKALAWLEEKELGLRVADGRKGWREQPPRMEKFVSSLGVVELTAPHGVYQKAAPLKDLPVPSELTLLGVYARDKEKERDNRKNARVQVYYLAPHADLEAAMKKAKAHVLAQEMTEGDTRYKLEPSTEAGTGDLGKKATLGDKTGQIGEFCLKIDGEAKRLFVLGVVNLEDRTCLIACDVVWDNRQIWHDDFFDLLKKAKIRNASE
jgi:hypothetical protein